MPDSKERILPHATPVPTTMVAASIDGDDPDQAGSGISPGYLRVGAQTR